jgi:hypothetical protein
MAGILFTDERMVLAGCRSNGVITGIGGKRKQDETPYKTAVRETLEELFEYKKVPVKMIEAVIESVPYKKIIKNGSYVFLLYSFPIIKQ